MRKNYIIKDARRILAEQIRDNGMNTMNKNPITNATGLSAIIPKDNDGYCTVYKMDCEDGLGLMTVYQVYTGIQLIYNDFEATSCYWDGTIDKNVLEINHCREGREGSVLQSGSCLYLGEGDLSIHTMDNCASEMAFPLRHYRGISVVLDLELVSQNPPGILAESGIGIADFKNKFCADGACFVMRAKDEIEHIFSELYSVPDCLQKPYFMLKVQELLLFLCMVDSGGRTMRTFEEVLTHFHSFLESATYLDVVPCRWGYVRLFNEGDPINFNAILCRTPQELYTALANDLETEIQISLGID